MFDALTRIFKTDNTVEADIIGSRDIRIDGFESVLSVPEPTKEDRRFARDMKNAQSTRVQKELYGAIKRGENWRVWYLINRPLRLTADGLMGVFRNKIKSIGFEGGPRTEDALRNAAVYDNATAAWLLLKFAEKHPRREYTDEPMQSPAPEERRRAQLEELTLKALNQAAGGKGDKAFAFLAHNFAQLAARHENGADHLAAQASAMKQIALKAAAAKNHGQLDALHAEKLLTPPQFVEAFMGSFLQDDLFSRRGNGSAQTRRPLLAWLMNKGFVDETFADQAATVEVRVADARRFNEEARRKGWRLSRRALETADGQTHGPHGAQVEISRRDGATGKVLTYVFNYTAQAAYLIKGALQNRLPLEKIPDQALVEEGRAFLQSCQPETPELTWKKGEPFRLQMKQTP
jgi:hypothetical protein